MSGKLINYAGPKVGKGGTSEVELVDARSSSLNGIAAIGVEELIDDWSIEFFRFCRLLAAFWIGSIAATILLTFFALLFALAINAFHFWSDE